MEVYEMIEDQGRRGVETSFFELDDMLNGLQNGEMIIVAARPSMGKAQPLDAGVLTTSGFKRMGDLRLGDQLASVDGDSSQVTGIYPQGQRQVYRMTFADGRSTECCAEHLWRVHCRQWPEPRVLSTARVIELFNASDIETACGSRHSRAISARTSFPLDPWLLGSPGRWDDLGGRIRLSTADEQVLERFRRKWRGNRRHTRRQLRLPHHPARRRDRAGFRASIPIHSSRLAAIGPVEHSAETKFIPPAYQTASTNRACVSSRDCSTLMAGSKGSARCASVQAVSVSPAMLSNSFARSVEPPAISPSVRVTPTSAKSGAASSRMFATSSSPIRPD